MIIFNKGFYVHSRVYSDTFKNKPYTVPQREQVYTTPVHKPLDIPLIQSWETESDIQETLKAKK